MIAKCSIFLHTNKIIHSLNSIHVDANVVLQHLKKKKIHVKCPENLIPV